MIWSVLYPSSRPTTNAGTTMNRHAIVQTLQRKIPELLASYAFGSRAKGTANAQSNLDLAVLVAG